MQNVRYLDLGFLYGIVWVGDADAKPLARRFVYIGALRDFMYFHSTDYNSITDKTRFEHKPANLQLHESLARTTCSCATL